MSKSQDEQFKLESSRVAFPVTIKKFVKAKFGHQQTSGLSIQNVDELNLLRQENKSLEKALEKVEQNLEKKLVIKEEKAKLEQDQNQANNILNAKVIEL